MFRNYLKIALRNLWKHKSSTLINVVGLSIAFCSSVLLFLSAAFELSFDKFHTNAEGIFRTYFVINDPKGQERSASMPYPFVPALKQEYPEVAFATRYQQGNGAVQYKDKQLAKEIDGVDPDMLSMFSFPMRQGNAQTALNSLSSIVISEDMANDLFGKENPMGKPLRINGFGGWRNFIVTGVVADAPDNSTFQFDAFIRIENQPAYLEGLKRWDNTNHEAYVALRPGVDQAAFEKRLQPFTQKYFQSEISYLKQQGARPDERGELYSIRLQPLLDVHFDTDLIQGHGINRMYVYTLMAIGLFILVIAAINFINLTLARSFTRAREVGVRKSLGAQRGQLFAQLWGETLLTCGLGLVIGAVLVVTLRQPFNVLFNAKLSADFIMQPTTLLIALAGFLLVTLLAGGYPALVMTRFQTVQVLKGKVTSGKPGTLRNALIVTQFAIACLLIIGTFVVLRQTSYLRGKPLGFNKEQVISIPVGNEVEGTYALAQLRNRLASNPSVVTMTGTGVNIGRGLDGSSQRGMVGFVHKGREVTSDWLRVDYDYLQTLGIKLLAGRDFSRQHPVDSTTSVIVSTSFAKQLGEKQPIGAFFQTDSAGGKYQIIGLIPDFHLYALRSEIKPIAMHLHQDAEIRYILMRVAPQNMVSMMETLKREWREIAPRSEFLGSFLNENTDRWYRQEEKMAQMLSLAAGIAIALSCMGLFAIALLSIQQRTKEIGVRKVLGASVVSIVGLLSRDFIKLVLIAIMIASPVAWWAMNQWLSDFAYKIDIEWWVFVLAGLLAILIALLTVSFQSIKAALMNPVKSLRTE
ncbi:FtsX-like permease family protein [Spirosoma taeanense]|uniref:FtsX-like permease family protein n=1 Tax=Spirosoma taeanense TaxID=2735870 RepID=A0A6M5YDU4_9BACT|nr:ABC transporter permease [Spirosoma taeanense]QJW91486.1 FtsX-like permease family protein [Spirosoma taeanense]